MNKLHGVTGWVGGGVALAMGLVMEGSTQAQPTARLTATGLVVTATAPAVLPKTELASFAAGCFWGVEQEFRKEPGVIATAVGYAGGRTPNPTYDDVSLGHTGHAETVRVAYDPKVVSYARLLDLFWHLHDPTTPGRQGLDVGDQYRSVVFTFSPAQQQQALASRDALQRSGELVGTIATEIVPAGAFTKAEDYHQQFVEKGGRAACHVRRKAKR